MRGQRVYLVLLIYGIITLADGVIGDLLLPLLRILALCIAIIAGGLVYYFDAYRPSHRWKTYSLGVQLPFILRVITVNMQARFQEPKDLCANIMRARRKFPTRGWKPLQIDFYTNGYTQAELEQKYNYDVGCCGTALARNEQIYFDSQKAHEPYKGMTETQRITTARINSVLSTPVYSPSDIDKKTPIAILNLDSESQISQTRFDQSDVKERATKFATLVGSLLS